MAHATRPAKRHGLSRWRFFSLSRCIVQLLPLLVLAPGMLRAQAPPETVGRIEGTDIAVKGAAGVEVESGRSITALASGSEVTVRSGQARLLLVEGGEIDVCAPAHFSLLKSGGAITLALDYGRIHARLEQNIPLTIYTPLIVATPIAIADRPLDATIGLEAAGTMCALAARGAVRIEQQLTGQTILVPQSGEVALAGGQLDSLRGAAGGCQCEVLSAAASPPLRPKPPQLSVPAPAGLAKRNQPVGQEELRPPAIEEPIYKVMMPPLTFDAAAPPPPPGPSPKTILLVREVRVRPAEVFRGRVEKRSRAPAARPVEISATAEDSSSKKHAGLTVYLGRFFRRIFAPHRRCAGAGCA